VVRAFDTRGVPEDVILDNGPTFIGRALDQWAAAEAGGCPSLMDEHGR
jgi:hypothetical protein